MDGRRGGSWGVVRGRRAWFALGGLATSLAVTGQVPATARAQELTPMELNRLTGPVEIDGRPDEAAWREVPPLPLTQYAPTYRGTPRQRTEIRVAYDDRYLYAAGWFYDSDPDGIRINSLYRDRWNGDDAFAIYVDAFNDNQTAKWFGTTPAGIRFDQLVTDDGASLNGSWDTFWDAATTTGRAGWFAEIRIPFSSLGFQVGDAEEVVMGLTVTRLVSRSGERVTFPDIDPRFEFRRPSVARDVVLRGVGSRRPLYVTPYLLSGFGRESVRQGTAYAPERSYPREAGLDLRYAFSPNATLDLTANTDFAQVEADDQQVNLDRFSLFFPEKRRFFQEQSGVFDFALGGGTRLFHSRRIGLDAAREVVPVLGGARLVSRVGEWDVGILDMQTDRAGQTPGENFGVARARRRVFNPFSYVGGMVTTRASDGRYNVGMGVDGTFRLFGDHYLTVKGASTFDDRDGAGVAVPERAHAQLRWQRRTSRGLAFDVDVARSGPAFLPEVGFARRSDFTQANLLANWYFFTDGHPHFRRVWPGALAFSTFRNGDGALESGQYAVWVQWDTKAGGGGWIEPKLFVEDVVAPFSIGGDVEIPAGRHEYADLQLFWYMPTGRRLRTSVDFRSGTFFDGTRTQLVVGPTWNASRHFEVGADYQWTRLRFEDRGQGSDLHLARIRVNTALNSRASGNAFLQYNSTTNELDLNVRLRYNFGEGEDLWIVFDEGLATDLLPDPTQPRLPRSLSRALIVKYTHTWGR